MRVFWIALLIALLPLRSWAGDAMAVSMNAPAAVQAVQQTQVPCHEALTAEAVPTNGAADHGDHDHHTSSDDHPTHGHVLCDVCNGPAMATAGTALEATTARHAVHADRVERFVSLLPRHLQKPPIA